MSFRRITLIVASACVFIAPPVAADKQPVNIYSARQAQLIQPLLERFTVATGYEVNLVTGKADALLERLKIEGANSPADILLTADVARLNQAKRGGLLQPVSSDVLTARIPSRYRDPDGRWFGMSLRARVIMVAERAYADLSPHLRDYEDLADLRWRGNICIRSSSNVYNQSLTASLLARHGEGATLAWAQNLVNNFARAPTGGDRDQILAAAGGLCDIAVANTYYLAMMLHGNNPAQRKAAQAVRVIWPNQDNRGAHINVSAAGVTTAATNKDGALALLEFLTDKESQSWYAAVNNEFPVVASAKVDEALPGWNDFKRDTIGLSRLGELNTLAVKLMDRAGWR